MLATLVTAMPIGDDWPSSFPETLAPRLSCEGRVEGGRGSLGRHPVSPPRSSNRTCGFPASGSPTGFPARLTGRSCKRHLVLRLATQLPRKRPDRMRCFQAHRQSPHLGFFESAPEVRVLPSTGIARLPRYYDPLRTPARCAAMCDVEAATSDQRVSPFVTF